MCVLEPFKFVEIDKTAHNVKELLDICRSFPVESANYLDRGDLEKWLFYIGEINTAYKAVTARELSVPSREKLENFLESYSETPSVSSPVSSSSATTPSSPEPSSPPSSTPSSPAFSSSSSISSSPEPDPSSPPSPTPPSPVSSSPSSTSSSPEPSSPPSPSPKRRTLIPQWLANIFNIGKK